MPEIDTNLQNCYNRGCGQQFNPNNNDKDDCRHHPGMPFFHDAYKGWSCCNKKCTDFTEFLNIKGCTLAKHSNEKPPEPPKAKPDIDKEAVIEVKAPSPIVASKLVRPPYITPLVILKPSIAAALNKVVEAAGIQKPEKEKSDIVEIGTLCKNGGCNTSYEGPATDQTICTHHTGSPIFHEGMKYWSCCKKKTSDFNAFLNQAGCTTGTHKWKKEEHVEGTVKCRWDWHQTPEFVIVTIYAKQCHPVKSYVKVNPIRLMAKILFATTPASFDLDMELKGIIDVEKSSVQMTPSKVEIKLRKAEFSSWSKLEILRQDPAEPTSQDSETVPKSVEQDQPDDVVDLSSVEAIHSIGNVNITEVN